MHEVNSKQRFDWSRIWLPALLAIITAGLPFLVAWGRIQTQIDVLERQVLRTDVKADRVVDVAQDVAVLTSQMIEAKASLNRIENSLSRYDRSYPYRSTGRDRDIEE